MKVVDSLGRECFAGEVGEMWVKGPARSPGYFAEPALNEQTFTKDGWCRTGDLGLIGADSDVTFKDRLKDLIKVGGENVTAAEIEAFLRRHPGIKLVQVVGVPDARLTEVPAAFIECVPGVSLNEAAVRSFCDGKISRVRIPKYIRFVTDWPEASQPGKIQKAILRQRLIQELSLK